MSQDIVSRLREFWKENKRDDFNKLYALSKWMLTKEKVKEIDLALDKREIKEIIQRNPNTVINKEILEYFFVLFPGSKYRY